MAQQQLLLFILATIIVGVGIYMGILLFAGNNASQNQEAMIADLQELGADAYAYIYRPSMMGGGGGSYTRYDISDKGPWGPENNNAAYAIARKSQTVIQFIAYSKTVEGASVSIAYDNYGKIVSGPTSSGF